MSHLFQIYVPPRSQSPSPIVQPEPQRPPLTPTTPLLLTTNAALKVPIATKPGSPGLTDITKILRRLTPSRASSSGDNTASAIQSTMPAIVPPAHQRSSSAGPPGAVSGKGPGKGKGKKFRRSWSSQKRADYNFLTENDIQGIVMLEILGATDLPKLKNSESPPHPHPSIHPSTLHLIG